MDYLNRFCDFAFTQQWTVHLATAALYVSFLLVERATPLEKTQGLPGMLRNLSYGMIKFFLGGIGLFAILPLLPSLGPVWLPSGIVGDVLYTLGFIALFDFIFYWYHWVEHRVKWIWPLHELHHSDAELNVTSSFRTYFLETPLQFLFIVFPCYLILGYDPERQLVATLIITVQLLFTHANLKIGYGWFNKVLCSPQVHRIHHSVLECTGIRIWFNFSLFSISFSARIIIQQKMNTRQLELTL